MPFRGIKRLTSFLWARRRHGAGLRHLPNLMPFRGGFPRGVPEYGSLHLEAHLIVLMRSDWSGTVSILHEYQYPVPEKRKTLRLNVSYFLWLAVNSYVLQRSRVESRTAMGVWIQFYSWQRSSALHGERQFGGGCWLCRGCHSSGVALPCDPATLLAFCMQTTATRLLCSAVLDP